MNHKPVLDRIARHLGREYGRNATGAVYHIPGEGYHVISYDNTTWYPYDESGEPVLGYGATRTDHAATRSALRHSKFGLAHGRQWPEPIADIRPIMEQHRMKRSELQQIIREEITRMLSESSSNTIENFIKTYAGDTLELLDMQSEIDDIQKMANTMDKRSFTEKMKFGYPNAKKDDIEDFFDSLK